MSTDEKMRVAFLMGSESDRPLLEESGAEPLLQKLGLETYVGVASAHRNDAELTEWLDQHASHVDAFICIAGLANALAAKTAAHVNTGKFEPVPVLGVALDEHGRDPIAYTAPGLPIPLFEMGKNAIGQAALFSAIMLSKANPELAINLQAELLRKKEARPINLPPMYDEIDEGKTKIILEDVIGDGTRVLLRSKDDITAGDGSRRDVIERKSVIANTTTVNVFKLLQNNGIHTHFVSQYDERTFEAKKLKMIPLECVIRRVATGSYLKRNPEIAEGTVFDALIFEVFEKDDDNNDPMLEFDFDKGIIERFVASRPKKDGYMGEQPIADSIINDLTEEQLSVLEERSLEVFKVIEKAWADCENVQLVDLKIEFGIDMETGELLVGDVIDNDSWRIWPDGDKTKMKDKQVYRELTEVDDPAKRAKELGQIKKNYYWVAEATEKFNK